MRRGDGGAIAVYIKEAYVVKSDRLYAKLYLIKVCDSDEKVNLLPSAVETTSYLFYCMCERSIDSVYLLVDIPRPHAVGQGSHLFQA